MTRCVCVFVCVMSEPTSSTLVISLDCGFFVDKKGNLMSKPGSIKAAAATRKQTVKQIQMV